MYCHEVFEVIVLALGDVAKDVEPTLLTPQPVLYHAVDAEQAKQMAVEAQLHKGYKLTEVAILARPFCAR